jgi:hypothetical protein
MDARDVKTQPPLLQKGENILSKMLELHAELIPPYLKIEKISQTFPVHINTKEAQILVKDFIARIVEELSEGYESLENYVVSRNVGNFVHDDIGDSSLISELFQSLQNFNEELADALHFYLELLIALGLNSEWLLDNVDMTNGLISHCYYSYGCNRQPLNLPQTFEEAERLKFLVEVPFWNYNTFADKVLYWGGRNTSQLDLHHVFKPMLWDVTHSLNLARNCLKNKPWKQSEVATDVNKFHYWIKRGFLQLFALFGVAGYNSDVLIYHLYWKKHEVNKFRIQSKY